jgi:hypothetical protein
MAGDLSRGVNDAEGCGIVGSAVNEGEGAGVVVRCCKFAATPKLKETS